MATTPVSPKVKAGSLSGATSVLVLYLLSQIHLVAALPDPVKAAALVLITAGVTWVAGYLKTDPLRRP